VWRVQTHPPICILEKRLVMLPLLLLAAPAAWLMTEEELTAICVRARVIWPLRGREGGGLGAQTCVQDDSLLRAGATVLCCVLWDCKQQLVIEGCRTAE